MVNLARASAFVQEHGSPIELARLAAIQGFTDEDGAGYAMVMAGQRYDGGFAPFWAEHYSSVDATAYRLAQVRPLDPAGEREGTLRALRFLATRQREDGAFEEEPSVAVLAPSWARPGDPAARSYLTANAGYMLAVYQCRAEARVAASWIDQVAFEPGTPLSPIARWLTAALLWTDARTERANAVLEALTPRLPDLEGGALAWCLTSLLEAGCPPDHPLLASAWALLGTRQRVDGSFDSQDGDAFAVGATLEVIRAARLREGAAPEPPANLGC